MERVPAAIFLFPLLLSAQADDHAMTLLKQAIAVARTTTTFRAESLYERTGGGTSFYRGGTQDGYNMSIADPLHVEENPTAAAFVSPDQAQLADGLHNCDLIRGDWTLVRNNGITGHAVSTLCIEPQRNLILRYESEATAAGTDLHAIQKLVLTTIDLSPPHSPALFAFSVPTGAIEDEEPPTRKRGACPRGRGLHEGCRRQPCGRPRSGLSRCPGRRCSE